MQPPTAVRFQVTPVPACQLSASNPFVILSLLNGDSGTLGDVGRKLVPCVCWLLQQDEFKYRPGGISQSKKRTKALILSLLVSWLRLVGAVKGLGTGVGVG